MKRALLMTFGLLGCAAAAEADHDAARRHMVKEIKKLAATTANATGIAEFSPRVLKAMGEVPRHAFVPREQSASAYRNHPAPIGHGQTISQPFIVALMTELARVEDQDRILEVGTGSGYQAAVLSKLARKVYSIEIVPELGKSARKVLAGLGYTNVTTRIGDGYQGWAEQAPFDAILVTAAPDHVPPALVEQLKPGGRMIIPVSSGGLVGGVSQDLMVVTKNADGTTTSATIVPVRFVPLTRE
jgi:protein-L-isoaspartate(D-aspartate) O-methyltransferase